jgi:hypothetical protein
MSNFTDSDNEIVQLSTARKLAHIAMDAESCLYSQWFPGKFNEVSDACSRDFHLSDLELTKLILTFVPNQVPFGFRICQFPREIASWLTCLLQKQPQEMQWNQQPLPSKLSLGVDTKSILIPSQSNQTLTSTISPNSNESKYSELLPKQYVTVDSIIEEMVKSNQTLVEPPSIAWHRPSAWQIDPTQDLMQMENLHFFYNANSEVTEN